MTKILRAKRNLTSVNGKFLVSTAWQIVKASESRPPHRTCPCQKCALRRAKEAARAPVMAILNGERECSVPLTSSELADHYGLDSQKVKIFI